MKRYSNCGTSTSQYVIIIALIVIALVPIFFVVGKSLIKYFENMGSGLNNTQINTNKTTAKTKTNNTSTEYQAGMLGGKPDNPVKECNKNSCTVDFGEFILNGVPKDFDNYLQASGTSGGTDKISALMEQIAKQLEQQGDTDGAQQYRDLSNLGHAIAGMQKNIEEIAEDCYMIKGQDPMECFDKNKYYAYAGIPEDLKRLVPDYRQSYVDGSLINIDRARADQLNHPKNFEMNKKSSPTYAMLDIYDNIMKNTKYSDSMKAVTTELMKNISDLTFDHYYAMEKVNETYYNSKHPDAPTPVSYMTKHDFITATATNADDYYYYKNSGLKADLGDIAYPSRGKHVDLNSALICATGRNKDFNNKCR